MSQTMYTLDPHQGLSVQERLRAASDGLRQVGANPQDLVRLVMGIAVVALVACVAILVLGRVRRARWIGRHLRFLRAGGLQPEEIDLFRAVARFSDIARVPLLVRNRGAFDFAASEYVRRFQPPDGRREALSSALSLRRRIPFDQRWQEPPDVEVGAAVTIVARLDARRVRHLEGRVLGTPSHALQIGLQVGADDQDVAGRLRTGQDVMLVVRRGVVLQEARVRIRGRCVGRTLQILVDRPVALTASRVRLGWRGAAERVVVEMVERFSERLVGDEVPRHEASICAMTSDGLLLRFQNVRPRHGEAIRIVSGAQAGVYRVFTGLSVHGKGGEVFVLRRQNDRGAERAVADATSSHGAAEGSA